jgi:TolA-binding protein
VEEPVELAGHSLPQDQYFSPDSTWLILEETNSFEVTTPRITLQALADSTVREVQAGLNTHSTWFRMPVAPPAPPTDIQAIQPTVEASATREAGPINLQSDVPVRTGRSLLVPLLVWASLLIAVMVLAYLLWKRSVLAKVEHLAIGESEAEHQPVTEEPAQGLSPEEVQAAFQHGVDLIRAERLEEGIAELRQVIAASPRDEIAWFWLGIASVRQKSYRTAERCFLQAKQHGHPEAVKALEWLRKQM